MSDSISDPEVRMLAAIAASLALLGSATLTGRVLGGASFIVAGDSPWHEDVRSARRAIEKGDLALADSFLGLALTSARSGSSWSAFSRISMAC